METSLTIDYDKQWLSCVSAIGPQCLVNDSVNLSTRQWFVPLYIRLTHACLCLHMPHDAHHRVMSLLWWRALAQIIGNLFYHFDSLPSFLYFLFTFNTVYTASHYTTDTTIVLVKRFGSNKTRLNPLIWHKKNMHVIHFFFVNVFLRKWTLICTVF